MMRRFPSLLVILALLCGCQRDPARNPQTLERPVGTGSAREEAGLLSGNGVIEATEVDLTAKITGRLIAVGFGEGEDVRPGDQVATLEAGELVGQVMQASGALEAAKARLAELRAGTRPEEIVRARAEFEASERAVTQARARERLVKAGPRKEQIAQARAALDALEATHADAARELARAERLERDGAIAGMQVDLARTRRDVAKAQADAAGQKLAEALAGARSQEREEVEAAVAFAEARRDVARAALDLALAGPRAETIAAAAAQVDQSEGIAYSARAALENSRVICPLRGRVTLRSLEPGELVTPGASILRIAELERVWLKVYIPEEAVGRVKIGQPADVFADAFPARRFSGKVTEISQKPEFTPKNVQTKGERVKLVFAVKIGLANPDGDLKPGMPADAAIRVGP